MNTRTRIYLLITLGVLILVCGCKKRKKIDIEDIELPPAPKLPEPAGGIVLSIESTAISADELIEPVSEQLAALAGQYDYPIFKKKASAMMGGVLLQKIADIKLYIKAKAALPENIDEDKIDQVVEQEVQRFIATYGGNYATVEDMLKRMGITWQDFHDQQKRAILVQSFVSEEVKVEKPITHSELREYYESIKEGSYGHEPFYEIRLIDLDIREFSDANTSPAQARDKAMEFAQKLKRRIDNEDNFAELAKLHSQDESAPNGGLWKPFGPGALVAPYDMIEIIASNIEIGRVSDPVFADDHVFIVKLENKDEGGYEPFEKVQTEVEGRYVLERREKMVDKMIGEIMSQVDLSYADNFMEYCVQQAWMRFGR
ncbi:MAG: peptidylprolyl isomerase [Sedimentisphaerales bacterium]|nr:peptidylprolyl isomerase [Sedimentisphaerales bacterium]